MSLHVRVDMPQKDQNLIHSSVGVITDNKKIIVDSPMNGNVEEYESEQDRLESLLYRCLNFTSKFCGVDELSGEKYPYDSNGTDGQIFLYRLNGVKGISDHHCAGSIQYHKKNEHKLFWLEIMLWNRYNIIPNHSLINTKVKIKRTSGLIEDGEINGTYPIRLSKSKQQYVIKILLENGDKVRHFDIHEILELNPGLELSVIAPSIDNMEIPSWVKYEYDEWISNINNDMRWNTKIPLIKFE